MLEFLSISTLRFRRHKRSGRFLFFLGILALFVLAETGCRHKTDTGQAPLARVGSKYLYVNDLKGLIPSGSSPRDSIQFCRSYINKWVHTQLLLQQAEKNLPEDKLNFQKRLEEYKNALIIYQYENEYVRQNMDTVVTQQEIDDYYKSHLKDFQLKENIVKVIYAIINRKREDAPQLNRVFWGMFHLSDSLLLDSLENYAPVMAETYSTDTNRWIPFNQLIRYIPIETYNQTLYLKNHRIIRLEDENKIYFVKFINFKIKDQISPEELETQFIREIILNKRKTKMIQHLRTEIFDQALKQKKFEIY
ncbi:hypothetical protein LA303_04335 [Candidatus Sulfidibacterium hydrothermale]|uniref:hypothetical protein n=1 Tax=Candidatus Sulfidibacterium hydrothermale TaxID=2875962 RepID=UPI001F0B4CE2|nr:hypothetical protein [Candidatus Sulfidibacterium hydrothermale]UBM63204.1 hypothetical protein LA303_04335 [Candidatus Sulfidibacterium hydrothermale]